MDDFFPTITLPDSFICNQDKYEHQANMDIYPYTHEPCNLEMIRIWKRKRKNGSGKCSCFCCVGSSCESVDSNQWLPLQCKLCMNINDVYFGKSETSFDVHVKVAFVLTSTIQFNICKLFILREFFA